MEVLETFYLGTRRRCARLIHFILLVIFDSCSEFLFTDGSMVKNAVLFRADMNSSVYIDNKNKDILILGGGPMQGLNHTTLTPEATYLINFTQPNKRFDLMFQLIKKIFIGLLT